MDVRQTQRRRRLLFFGLFCCVLALVLAKYLLPLYSKAQTTSLGKINTATPAAADDPGVNGDAIGPEFGVFDLVSQDKVYTNVIKANNFTGATQVINEHGPAYNPNPSATTPEQVFLRVAGVTSSLSIPDVKAYAERLNAYSGFPQGTIVIFGNEENNLDLEWKNPGDGLDGAAQKYADQFNAFASVLDPKKYRLSPAPPDMYNGVYDPVPWIKSFNSHIADCGKVTALVANVFDVTPRVPGANLDTYQYLESHICSGKKVTHFGGWGMDPNNHPSIQQQVDWLKKTALPAGVTTATTLIIDSCNGADSNTTKSGWLYYIRGKVYDIDGSLIDPATCGRKKSPYFEYNIQRASTATVMKNFLDEYSVACMPKADYNIIQNNIGTCLDPTKACPAGFRSWNVSGDLSLNSNSKLFGLFRDESQTNSRYQSDQPATNRLESIESYLGVNHVSQQDLNKIPGLDSASSLYYAPFYKLSTEVEQCTAVKNKLAAVAELCKDSNQIEGIDKTLACAIDTKIPNTQNETNGSLWNRVQSSECTNLMHPTDDAGQQLKKEILDTPITLENAYRPAFVVAVTRFDGAPSANTNVTVDTDPHRPVPNTYFTVVDYMEVKVPAFGSDFINPNATRANPDKNNTARDSYKDPLSLTAQVMTTLQQQQDFQQQVDAQRAQLRGAAANPNPNGLIGGIDNPVLCYKNNQLTDCTAEANSLAELASGQNLVKDTLPNALYSFINASAAVNPSLPCDSNEDDPAKFYDKLNIKKVAEQVTKIGSFLTPADKTGDFIKKTTAKVHLNVKIVDILKNPNNITTHTSLYFVSPHNDNLQFAQKSFYNFLTLGQQQQLTELGLLPKTSDSSTQGLDESQFPPALKTDTLGNTTGTEQKKIGIDLTAHTQPVPVIPGVIPQPQYNTFDYGVSFDSARDATGQPRKQPIFWKLAGQVASLPTRLMALVTTPIGSAINKYTLSCSKDPSDPNRPNPHATEDWLLGKCKGGSSDTPTPPVIGGQAYLAQEVVSTTDCKSFARIGGGPAEVTDPARLGPVCVGNNLPGVKYVSTLDVTRWKDSSDAVICNDAFYKSVVCTDGAGPTSDGLTRQGNSPALIAHKVDAQGNFSPSGVMTACEYVVKSAQTRGVSPKLALAMWGEESGFSAFTTSSSGQDFGVVSAASSRAIGGINKQVDGFLNTISGYSNYLTFLLNYSGEKDKSGTPPVYFCNNRQFPDRLKTFYGYLK